jgi:hypothetical protein
VKENYNTNQNEKSTGVGAQLLALSRFVPTPTYGITGGVVVTAQLESVFFQVQLGSFVSLSSELSKLVVGIRVPPRAVIVAPECSMESACGPELARLPLCWSVSRIRIGYMCEQVQT